MAMTSVSKDIFTDLQYVRVSNKGESLGPSKWGITDFEPEYEVKIPSKIHDLRGHEEEFQLDRNGFQVVHHQSLLGVDDFLHDQNVKDAYYREAEQMLKEITKSTLVKAIHHVLRHSNSADPSDLSVTRPLYKVHVDSTAERVKETIEETFPDISQTLLRKRYALINIWRPLETVRRDPLACCNGAGLIDQDFVVRELEMPNGMAPKKNTAITHGKNHKWYYLSEQNPDEVLLVKCWDTAQGVVRRCPHSAVRQEANEDGGPRQSIEVRCLVFWND
ncbi:Nn.00g101580.m01.CDS01 [Neocucurbitaria sp. VM-36]